MSTLSYHFPEFAIAAGVTVGNCSFRPWNGCRQAHFPR